MVEVQTINDTSMPVTSFRDDALSTHDAVALAALISKKELCPGALVDASIARAKRVNGSLNAIATTDLIALDPVPGKACQALSQEFLRLLKIPSKFEA